MTPSTKRGVNFPESAAVGLGWLSLTFRSHSDTTRGLLVRQVLEAIGESDPRPRDRAIKGYTDALDVLSDSAIGWTDERPREVHLTLKQQDCSWQRAGELLEVADGCESWRCTRLDLNFDDHTRAADPGTIAEACAAGQCVTRVDLDQVESIARRCIVQSVYVGSRSSDRYLNVYDKDAERAQVLGKPVALGTYGVRWELRLRNERATAQLNALRGLADVDELLAAFWGAVSTLVDFRQRDRSRRGHHLDGLPRVAWFARLAGDVARQSTYLPRAPETEDWRYWRLHRWLFGCAAAVAELVQRSPDREILYELISDGAERLEQRRLRAAARVAAA
jgi:Replication initiation factor